MNWRRWVGWTLIQAAALLVQTALLPRWFAPGYAPDVVLSVTVVLALRADPLGGLLVGLIGGGLQDIAAGRLLGLNACTLAFLGWAVAWTKRMVAYDRVFVPALLAGVAQLVMVPWQWLVLKVAGFSFSWHAFTRPLPGWILFALVFTPGLMALLRPPTGRREFRR